MNSVDHAVGEADKSLVSVELSTIDLAYKPRRELIEKILHMVI